MLNHPTLDRLRELGPFRQPELITGLVVLCSIAFWTTDRYHHLPSFFAGMIAMVVIPITAITLIVGGIVVMNIMLVSVTERTFEVGLRKAVGATRRQILTQFMIESAILCALGGILGLLAAWGVTTLITTPRAIEGSTHMVCSAVMMPSRPNGVENHGTPA